MTGGIVLAGLNFGIVMVNSLFDKKIPMIVGLSNSELADNKQVATFGRVRKQLGEITALGLEMLIAADVMESLAEHTSDFSWHTLGKLAFIAAFRTVLAYTLGKEIEEIEEKIVHEKEDILQSGEMMYTASVS